MTHQDRIIVEFNPGFGNFIFGTRYQATAERQYSPGGLWCYIPPFVTACTLKRAEKKIIKALEEYDREERGETLKLSYTRVLR